MKVSRLILALVALALASTTGTLSAWGSKTVTLTIHSSPEGALMTEGGKTWGYTPFTLAYHPKEFRVCLPTSAISVQWVSGATAAIDAVSLCPAVGTNQQFTFERPTVASVEPPKGVASWLLPALDLAPGGPIPAPGLDVDLQFAFQRELLARLDANAAALASQNAWTQAANAFTAAMRQYPIVRPVRCTSMVIGRQIFTNCY